MRILITSGGTKVPIDRVRNITNMSSGTFGSKIAFEALKNGHEVVFVAAEGSKSPMSTTITCYQEGGFDITDVCRWYEERSEYIKQYKEYRYATFDDYQKALKFGILTDHPDVVVLAAAVSDYGVKNYVDGKARSARSLIIQLEPLPKVISMVKQWAPKVKLIGFKLLVDSTDIELTIAAEKSVKENGCEFVVANDLRDIKEGKHKLAFVYQNAVGYEYSKPDDPNYLARSVVERIEKLWLP